MHSAMGVQEEKWFDWRLCFNGDAKRSIEKRFERLIGEVECSFREKENRNSSSQNRLEDSHALCALLGISPIYHHHGSPINISKHRHLRHFRFTQCPDRSSQRFYNQRCI